MTEVSKGLQQQVRTIIKAQGITSLMDIKLQPLIDEYPKIQSLEIDIDHVRSVSELSP